MNVNKENTEVVLWVKAWATQKMWTVAFKQSKAGLISSALPHSTTMTASFPKMTQGHRDDPAQGPLRQLLFDPQRKLVLSEDGTLKYSHGRSVVRCVYKKAKTEPPSLPSVHKFLILSQECCIPSIHSDKLTG